MLIPLPHGVMNHGLPLMRPLYGRELIQDAGGLRESGSKVFWNQVWAVSTKLRALPEHSTLLSAKMTSRILSSSSQSTSPRQTASVASAQTVRADVASSQTNRFCLYPPPIRSLCCHAAPSGPGDFVTGVVELGHWPRATAVVVVDTSLGGKAASSRNHNQSL